MPIKKGGQTFKEIAGQNQDFPDLQCVFTQVLDKFRVDDSSFLSLTDAVIAFKIFSGMPASSFPKTDVGNNGNIELGDAIFILKEVSNGM